ncbi:hypothetical protein NDU88_001519 [Pleurodeles waltl]|uniref:Uncharacterized protein n=1 Tax=Pleurodeles waltl TaxID=8319 RepID=A0AAV7NB03_PLEWA|nr:hypothetical protein NDU88_001519 [Pleurodeles waltl]
MVSGPKEDIAKSGKSSDQSREGRDKFNSLTDGLKSTSFSPSEDEASACLFIVSKNSSSTAPGATVKRRKHRGRLNARSAHVVKGDKESQEEGALKLDYSATMILYQEGGPENPSVSKGDSHNDLTAETGDSMLRLIYCTIKELQTETWAKSWRVLLATKYLQGAIKKMPKTYVEIREKLNTSEERTVLVEAYMEALRGQVKSRGGNSLISSGI